MLNFELKPSAIVIFAFHNRAVYLALVIMLFAEQSCMRLFVFHRAETQMNSAVVGYALAYYLLLFGFFKEGAVNINRVVFSHYYRLSDMY